MTRNAIAKYIREQVGESVGPVSIYRGKGYWYFHGGASDKFKEQGVYGVKNIGDLSKEQWLAAFREKLGNCQRGAMPDPECTCNRNHVDDDEHAPDCGKTRPTTDIVERLETEFNRVAVCHCGNGLDHPEWCGDHSPSWNRCPESQMLHDAKHEITKLRGVIRGVLKHIHDEGEDSTLNRYKFMDELRAAIESSPNPPPTT